MNQVIAGVAPPEISEVTIMTVWPSIASTAPGRLLGQLCSISAGIGVVTVGNLLALALAPGAAKLYLAMRIPWFARTYRLTNRRIIIQKGLSAPTEVVSAALDEFDDIEIRVRPGQAWYPAGDMVFRKGPVEVLTLPGVSRPEPFRQTCLKARNAYVAVAKVRKRQPAVMA